jgi:hypothetical protein
MTKKKDYFKKTDNQLRKTADKKPFFDSHPEYYSDLIPEEEKLTYEYIKYHAQKAIGELVINKPIENMEYNFYNLYRDPKEYAYLSENFGIGNPSKIPFVPLIRNHIQYLLGQFLQSDLDFRVTCTDDKSLNEIKDLRHFQLMKELVDRTSQFMKDSMEYHDTTLDSSDEKNKQPQNKPPQNPLAEEEFENLLHKYNVSWKSDMEITAQNLIEYFKHAKDLKNVGMKLFEHLCISGYVIYRVVINELGTDPELEICDPRHTFFNRSYEPMDFKKARRVVRREFMTRQQILQKYGHFMTEDEREYIMSPSLPIAVNADLMFGFRAGLQQDYMGTTLVPGYQRFSEQIEVFHGEFLSDNLTKVTDPDEIDNLAVLENEDNIKKLPDEIMRGMCERYHWSSIGRTGLFFNMGRSKYVARSVEKPYECSLTYGGFAYQDVNGDPLSLIKATKDLQDDYDLTMYFRNILLAHAGVGGTRIDLESIPNFLGPTDVERIQKFIAYRKQGLELVSPNQEANKGTFQHYGEFSDGLRSDILQALEQILQNTAERARMITGVSRQSEGQIEQRDGLGNTQQAVIQSEVITKPLFNAMNSALKQMLTDLLNASKISYSKGKRASYITGTGEQKIFTIDPDKFILSDYDVHVSLMSDEKNNLDFVKSLVLESAKNGQPIENLNDLLKLGTTKSLTEAKTEAKIINDKLKTSQTKQLQEQLRQLQEQLKQAQADGKKLNEQDLANKKRELDLREKQMMIDKELEERKLTQRQEIENKKAELEEKMLSVQTLQLSDDNPFNDKIRQVGTEPK